ncbi:MAG: hypothetical protein V2A76_17380 [Planctomycetota bacterium]
MMRMRTPLALFVTGFVIVTPLLADSFELTPKKIKLNDKNAEIFPEIVLRVQASLPGVTKEPKYHSKNPQRFASTFGKGGEVRVSLVVDERKGPGKGYDCLVADIAGAGDLSQGKKVSGKPVKRGISYEDTSFSPFEVELKTDGSPTQLPVQARFSVSRNGPGDPSPRDSSLYLTALHALTGSVMFGDKKVDMVVFDANCNGTFGDKGVPRGKLGAAPGDKVWIGTGSASLEDACMEAIPIGKYYLFEGEYYEVGFTQSGVEIAKATVPLGRIRVSNPGYLLELVQGDDVLYVSAEKEQEIDVPVGRYQINTPGFRRRGRGGIWELEGEPGGCKESFTVGEGQVTEIALGPPIRLVITGTTQAQGNGIVVYLDFAIEGSTGEKYKYLRQNGKKVDLPEVFIRTPGNKLVKKGRFEYG